MPQALIPILSLGLAGAGTVGNIIQGGQGQKQAQTLEGAQTSEINWMQQYQDFLKSITPQQISQMITSATQPLSSNLTQSVTDPIRASLAAAGLGESPGTLATQEGTALAPFVQNEQGLASQNIFQLLGLPLQAGNSILSGTSNAPSFIPPPANTGGAWQAVLQSLQKKGGGGGASPSPSGLTLPLDTGNWPSGTSLTPMPTPGSGINSDTFAAYTGMAA